MTVSFRGLTGLRSRARGEVAAEPQVPPRTLRFPTGGTPQMCTYCGYEIASTH